LRGRKHGTRSIKSAVRVWDLMEKSLCVHRHLDCDKAQSHSEIEV
jgi:hypothetical protein